MLWRIQIQPYNGFEFLSEPRVVAYFERARQVWLQSMLAPDPAHTLLADSGGRRHRACAPMSRVFRFLQGCPADHFLDLGGRDARRSPRTEGVLLQATDALFQEPLPPS